MSHLLLSAILFLPLPPTQGQEPLKVGMMQNIFGNLDEKKALAQVQMLAGEVEKRTGTKAEFTVVPDLATMEKELKSGRIQMAIMHGIEYAWLRPELPETKPLLIAVADQPSLQTVVVAAADQKVNVIEELKGQPFALAEVTPFHVQFYLRRTIKKEPGQFFQVHEAKGADDSLETVIAGKAKATAVSETAWNQFQENKPGRARKLRVVNTSPRLPAPVLILRPGEKVDQKQVDRFEKAMIQVHESDGGRQTLTLWRLKGFQKVPDDYLQQLDAFAKQYPPEK
jgi:ABC-type phosphate/phosphonate transport system substrate-binding protein